MRTAPSSTKRARKKGSNDEWKHPGDPDARITVQHADRGDTQTVLQTLLEASDQIKEALPDAAGVRDVVMDKGYHSNDVLADLGELGFRTYVTARAMPCEPTAAASTATMDRCCAGSEVRSPSAPMPTATRPVD